MTTTSTNLHLALERHADAYLSSDPLALLIGMLLDQQFPMERAFAGPYLLADRLGHRPTAAELATFDPEELVAVFARPPVLHRYPRAMAGRVQTLARFLVENYPGDAGRLWADVSSGSELLERLQALPGFGQQKARIFLALLGKQCGVRPRGWREAAGAYGEEGSRRSIADVTDERTLREVREFKRAVRAAARAG